MKKISLLLLAFATVLGMSQCKKNNEMMPIMLLQVRRLPLASELQVTMTVLRLLLLQIYRALGAAVLYVKLHTQMAIELLLPATVTM